MGLAHQCKLQRHHRINWQIFVLGRSEFLRSGENSLRNAQEKRSPPETVEMRPLQLCATSSDDVTGSNPRGFMVKKGLCTFLLASAPTVAFAGPSRLIWGSRGRERRCGRLLHFRQRRSHGDDLCLTNESGRPEPTAEPYRLKLRRQRRRNHLWQHRRFGAHRWWMRRGVHCDRVQHECTPEQSRGIQLPVTGQRSCDRRPNCVDTYEYRERSR